MVEGNRYMQKSTIVLGLLLWSTAVAAQSAGGVRWTVPAGWKTEAAQPMRAATYTVAAAPGDKAGGECIVSFFGAGQGGSVDANIERWRNQIQGTDGQPAKPDVAKKTVRGLSVTTIDTSGEYRAMGGPMMSKLPPAAGYRLLAAIVEGPGGNVFVKCTGPTKTIAANQQKFEQLLSSFQRE
jgi:hypothetical protein